MTPLPDEQLVSKLIARQFSEFADYPVSRLAPGGWDNVSFRLGEAMVVKLPRDRNYADQPKRERETLEALAGKLPLAIPKSIALGAPSELYPNHWSILEWIEGETIANARGIVCGLPCDLARFLRALHDLVPLNGPVPGIANFWRGGHLSHLNSEFETATKWRTADIDMGTVLTTWREAIATEHTVSNSWVHGDIAPANLLQRDRKLFAAIDFGLASVGDPACDMAIAWLAFNSSERERFIEAYGAADHCLLMRGRAWALWKSVLVLAGVSVQPAGYLPPDGVIHTICEESRAD